MGYLIAGTADSPQHFGLVGLTKYQDKVVNGIHFKLHCSHVGHELVHYIIEQSIHDPIAGDMEKILQRINTTKDVAHVSNRLIMDTNDKVFKHQKIQIDGLLLHGGPKE